MLADNSVFCWFHGLGAPELEIASLNMELSFYTFPEGLLLLEQDVLYLPFLCQL